jgi:hypothetical protein
MQSIKGRFHIYSNFLDVLVNLPVWFREDTRLDRATPEQIARIKDQLRKMSTFSNPCS